MADLGPEGTAMPAPPVSMLERLSSVHAVLGVQRQATEHDILITTVLEVLRAGPLSEVDLSVAVRGVWPGAGVSPEALLRALRIASKAGYVAASVVGGEPGWSLSRIGVREVEASRNWARDIVDATAADLRDRVQEAGLELSEEASRIWTHHLELALHASIRGAFAAYRGDVDQQSEWWLTPRTFDRSALIKSIESTTAESSHAALLTALAFDAIDPLSSFCSDLVTHITVGYMLHAFIGRRDHIGVRAAIGSLTGDRAILDTPVLLRLLADPDQRAPYERTIRGAIAAGMEVIAPEHYLEELQDVIARTGRDAVPAVRETLAQGVAPEMVAGVVDEGVVAIWLLAMSRGLYRAWEDFVVAGRDLATQLLSIGVVVRPHANPDQGQVARVDAVLAQFATNRGPLQRLRDANTIVMARRTRERVAHRHPFWPGAWVITTDQHMNAAYKESFGSDPFPIALTPGRLAGLISTCSTPATMENLAVSAASLLQSDTFLSIAARYPVPAAIGLARALGPSSGGSQLDLRLSQLTPAELMGEQPDPETADDEVGARVTAAVMTMRAERLNQSYLAGEARLRRRADTATMTARASQALQDALLRDKREAEAEREAFRAELNLIRQDAARVQTLRDRKWASRFGYAAAIIVAIFVVLQSNPLWLFVTAAGTLAYWHAASQWTRDPAQSWPQLVPGVLIEFLSLVLALAFAGHT